MSIDEHVEPHWRPARMVAEVPEDILPWLVDSASLTERLVAVCDQDFSVRILSEGWAQPMNNEIERLVRAGVDNGKYMVRQVFLLCGASPWVYARTVIPDMTLTGTEMQLANLKTRSLGAALFREPSLVRSEIEIVQLSERDRLYALVQSHMKGVDKSGPGSTLWGRRSVFTVHDKPLLVSEIFLPTMCGRRFASADERA